MPILGVPDLFELLVSLLAKRLQHLKFDRILGIESRGFLIGPVLAAKLKVPFGPVRKKGKLPGDLYSVEYELEYGKDVLQVQKNGLPKGSRCVIVDDLIATGGSLHASKNLIELSGSTVVACLVIIELSDLKGRSKLGTTETISLFSY